MVDATSANTIKKDFDAIWEYIKIPADATQDNQEVILVLNKLRELDEPWLVVFDNHDDPSSFFLPDFMPMGQEGRILITSRHADTAGLVGSDHHIKLPGLPKDDACDLLIRQSRGGDAASRDDAYTIVDRLGYHALAITQAGSYIQTQKIELSQFMDNYNHRREAILRVTPRMSQYRRKVGKAANETALNVFTTWEPSYQQLEKLDDENKHKSVILALFAFFDCQNISQQLFKTYCTKELFHRPDVWNIEEPLLLFLDENKNWVQQKFVDILNNLSQLSLIQSWYRDKGNQCHLSLHPLVRDWIRLRAPPQLCCDLAALSAYILATVIKQAASKDMFRMPLQLRQEILSHLNIHDDNQDLTVALNNSEAFSKDRLFSVYDCFTYFYYDYKLYKQSEVIARKWVEAMSVKYRREDDETLHALSVLSHVLRCQPEPEEALDISQRVFTIYSSKYSSESTSVLEATYFLAVDMLITREIVKAEGLLKRVIETAPRVLGRGHGLNLASKFVLVRVLWEGRKFGDAETLSRNNVQNSQRMFGNNHPTTITCMSNLADLLERLKRHSEAPPYIGKVYTFRLETWGPERPDTLEAKRDYYRVRGIVGQQLQSEQTRAKMISLSGNQNTDLKSDARSEASELDEFIFSIYEQNLLGSSEDAEQARISIPPGGQHTSC